MIGDEAIVAMLADELDDLVAVYRFGSTLEHEPGAGSDIDLAFLLERPIDHVRRFDLQERIAAALGHDVDLVDLQDASTVMRMQVVSKGKVLASFNEHARVLFEDYAFGSYVRLNEERRAILAQIEADGTVYGG